MAALLFYGIVRAVLRSRARTKELARPCPHGMPGALHDRRRCPECARADEEQKARQKEAEQARQKAEAARRLSEYRAYVARIRMPSYLEQMNPRDFELHVCEVYRRKGYEVKGTPYSGDSGINGFLRREGKLYLLQCKRVKGSVGQPVLRDLFGAMQHEHAAGGIIATTGRVSSPAREWARGKPIEIIELDGITKMTREVYPEDEFVPAGFTPREARNPVCPRCGSAMRLVRGRAGLFWGCTSYPSCRQTARYRGSPD